MSLSQLEEVPVASLAVEEEASIAAPVRQPSYQPYKWQFLNRVLDIVDGITRGKAGLLQRLTTFLFIGGLGALVNLAVYYLVFNVIGWPAQEFVRMVLAWALATEISLMANFIANDLVTFRNLPGHERAWWQRCVRFHVTSLSGSVLTFLIQSSLSTFAHITPIVAQAIALVIVTFYNFSIHHIFTYREAKLKPAK
ncbi:putative flippase GtrA [Thermosporothrix hazakensis]|uniref:GtrA/DPMS transmembrane domain-containing protein n=2 Tax=Thermosporothrix TaxID=768650 RepID=A0A455SU46_9CHLR|nr:GtrA family protein [Thermosporothrix hazakensis]PZW33037.1 putative flippase GtrA [Thermosporothrix hazakensis]BBH91018.1 hypothetical protein KTC_57690 [Thermosporothrix sp. COM3]GCE49069.1 hypothetical protein KTH_39380 [Thermosporothrix hazakensis]